VKPNCSILLVEDDADDVYFISRALRSSGLDTPLEVVNDGQAAIDFISRAGERAQQPGATIPCLVLLDLNLPHKSGLEVLKWIRRESDFKSVIVIVLSTSTSEDVMNRAYLRGANSSVIKPTDATKLGELAQYLKGFWFGWNQMPSSSNGVRAVA
jgi:CheY-like chemotaxis protein